MNAILHGSAGGGADTRRECYRKEDLGHRSKNRKRNEITGQLAIILKIVQS